MYNNISRLEDQKVRTHHSSNHTFCYHRYHHHHCLLLTLPASFAAASWGGWVEQAGFQNNFSKKTRRRKDVITDC
jgi:hypothetical protein